MVRAFQDAVVAGVCITSLWLTVQVAAPADSAVAQQPLDADEKLRLEKLSADLTGVERVIQVSDRIYSGTEPHGEAAFQTLAEMGVRAVVCVDGARPQVELARKYGLRYIHIPIGYDRITADDSGAITRAVREIEGPIYVHCHHGRHRGPAAAAIACIADGAADGRSALRVLETAGTSRKYPGLWRDVQSFKPPPPDAELPQLVEVAPVQSLTAAMAQIDRAWDHLKLCRDAKWTTPADHPDIVPARESLILQQRLENILADDSGEADKTLREWMDNAAERAGQLQAALAAGNSGVATRHFMALKTSCDRCHAKYRDR